MRGAQQQHIKLCCDCSHCMLLKVKNCAAAPAKGQPPKQMQEHTLSVTNRHINVLAKLHIGNSLTLHPARGCEPTRKTLLRPSLNLSLMPHSSQAADRPKPRQNSCPPATHSNSSWYRHQIAGLLWALETTIMPQPYSVQADPPPPPTPPHSTDTNDKASKCASAAMHRREATATAMHSTTQETAEPYNAAQALLRVPQKHGCAFVCMSAKHPAGLGCL